MASFIGLTTRKTYALEYAELITHCEVKRKSLLRRWRATGIVTLRWVAPVATLTDEGKTPCTSVTQSPELGSFKCWHDNGLSAIVSALTSRLR